MKKLEMISQGTNYAAATVGAWDELGRHTFTIAPGVEVPGKVFAGNAIGSTGLEVSFTTMEPGTGVDFLHTHKTNEEFYVVVRGSGQYQVDGTVFPIAEGSVVRVSPQGKRSWRNTGSQPLVMICIQSLAGSLKDAGIADAEVLAGGVNW